MNFLDVYHNLGGNIEQACAETKVMLDINSPLHRWVVEIEDKILDFLAKEYDKEVAENRFKMPK